MAVCNPEKYLEKNSTGLTPWNFDWAVQYVIHYSFHILHVPSTRLSAQLVIFFSFYGTQFLYKAICTQRNPNGLKYSFDVFHSTSKYTLT